MGWKGIDDIGKQNIEVLNKLEQLACSVFTTPNGKELMKLLTDKFLYAPVASPADSAAIAYWREGQNNIIRRFLNAINKKEQQAPPITETILTKKSKSEEIKK